MQDDFKIGEWLIQTRLNVIKGRKESTRVKPRSMAVLVCLAQADGEVVGKNELMDAVWGKSVVTEDVLTQSIVELRKAFGDDPKNPRLIETIPKVGYRLIADVSHASLKSEEINVAERSAEGIEQTMLRTPEWRFYIVGVTALFITFDENDGTYELAE